MLILLYVSTLCLFSIASVPSGILLFLSQMDSPIFVILKERLEVINMDQCEYTFDEEDRKVQDVILKREPSEHDTVVLKKTLSYSYPNIPFKEAIRKESEKLQLELQQSQAHLDVSQCEVIQHLLDVTEAVAVNSLPEKNSPVKKLETNYSDVSNASDHYSDDTYTKNNGTHSTSRLILCLSYVLKLHIMFVID